MDRYILDGKKVVPCPDLMEWASWFEKSDRRVAIDTIEGIMVSTTFLGLDHNFLDDSSGPLVFETISHDLELGNWDDKLQYHTWEEAEAGHKKIIEIVKARLEKSHQKSVSELNSIMEKSRLGKSSSDTP